MAYRPSSDKILLYTAVIPLLFFGLLMVYSASSVIVANKHGESYDLFLHQLQFAGFGFLALLALMNIDYRIFQKPKVLWPILILSAATLVIVMILPAKNGAHRWITIMGSSFQPSEFAKLAVLIFTAWFLHTHGKNLNNPKFIAIICGVVAVFAGLVIIEPDLGQAFIICSVTAILLIMAGLSWRYIAAAIGTITGLVLLVHTFFLDKIPAHWLNRITIFLHPEKDPKGLGWQINQASIAVGSGGISGLGLGDGRQKLFFLPESSTDFIFAVICEELGFIGAALVVAAFLVFFYRGMKIASKSQDRFGYYLGTGITLMVTLQGFINISMVLGMLPTKGIALPFISQGGSSLLMNLAATGILLNLSYQNKLVKAVELIPDGLYVSRKS